MQRKKEQTLKEANEKDRRPVGVGIHGKPLPSMEQDAGDVPWFERQRQQRPRSAVDRPWQAGSELDGHRKDDLGKSTGPGVVASRGARLDETTGRPVVRSGLLREGDPDDKEFKFKERTVRLLDMESYRKKKHLDFAEKPNKVDHWANARATAASGRPGDTIQRGSGHTRSAVHILPPAGSGSAGAPDTSGGATVGTTKRFSTRRWTDALLEHRALAEQDEDDHHLDDDGKELYTHPKDWAPMYSSFAADRVFRDEWNTRKPSFRAKPVGPGSQALRPSHSASYLRTRGSRLDPSLRGSRPSPVGSVSTLGGSRQAPPPVVVSRRDSFERRAYDGTFGSAAFNSAPAWPGAMKRRGSVHGTPVLLPSQEAAAAAAAERQGGSAVTAGGTSPVRLRPPETEEQAELREALASRGRQVPELLLKPRAAPSRGRGRASRGGAAGGRAGRRSSVEEIVPSRAPAPVVRPVASPQSMLGPGARPGSALA